METVFDYICPGVYVSTTDRSLKHTNEQHFNMDLYALSHVMSQRVIDTNACTRYFCGLLYDIVNIHAPVKTKIIHHNNVPYMNSEIRKWQYKRNMLRNAKRKIQINIIIWWNKKSVYIYIIMSFKEKQETNVRIYFIVILNLFSNSSY